MKLLVFSWMVFLSLLAQAKQPFADIVARIKPSIVGVGSFSVTRQPARVLWGTGFVVADGHHVITNWHVVDQLESEKNAMLSVFIGKELNVDILSARLIAKDEAHDLALLRFDGAQLPALKITSSENVREGDAFGFTGFPIGQVLGHYPVTHQGLIAAITPLMNPAVKAGRLDPKDIKRLREDSTIFQLDATAYPGNSGSPLYDIQTGEVVGVLNKVFVTQSKEKVLSEPSGISYAIPSQYVIELLRKAKLKPR